MDYSAWHSLSLVIGSIQHIFSPADKQGMKKLLKMSLICFVLFETMANKLYSYGISASYGLINVVRSDLLSESPSSGRVAQAQIYLLPKTNLLNLQISYQKRDFALEGKINTLQSNYITEGKLSYNSFGAGIVYFFPWPANIALEPFFGYRFVYGSGKIDLTGKGYGIENGEQHMQNDIKAKIKSYGHLIEMGLRYGGGFGFFLSYHESLEIFKIDSVESSIVNLVETEENTRSNTIVESLYLNLEGKSYVHYGRHVLLGIDYHLP